VLLAYGSYSTSYDGTVRLGFNKDYWSYLESMKGGGVYPDFENRLKW